MASLKSTLKQKILSASARALKVCSKFDLSEVSFIKIHEMYNRGTPKIFLLFKLALALFKLFQGNDLTTEFLALNQNTILTSRQINFIATKDNKRRVGLNVLANRFNLLNNIIPLSQFNKSIDSFKIFCKKEFLNC